MHNSSSVDSIAFNSHSTVLSTECMQLSGQVSEKQFIRI